MTWFSYPFISRKLQLFIDRISLLSPFLNQLQARVVSPCIITHLELDALGLDLDLVTILRSSASINKILFAVF